jgi:hypothetical protein
VAHTGTAELADGIEAANLDELVDRAIGRLTAVFRRTGAKYAPSVSSTSITILPRKSG